MHVRSSIEPSTEYSPDGAVLTAAEKSSARTVLVVEDDDAVSALLIDLLQERGYHAVPAFNGKTALSLARRLKPHLITLDLALPHLDGQAVLERLKADPDTRDIPVVVISAFTQILPAGDRKKLAYLLGKPFDVTEVLDIVQATVGNPYL
jgi:CheY-like chemotaxis protein